MLKKIFAALLTLLAVAAFAATDINKANQAELEAVKGIGPVLSQRLLDERKRGAFKDWPDLVERVKGIGTGNAARFSASGLTVNGTAYAGPSAATTTAAPKTPAGQRERVAVSRPTASASAATASASAADKPAVSRTTTSVLDKGAPKASGAGAPSRAALPATSAASAGKAGVKP